MLKFRLLWAVLVLFALARPASAAVFMPLTTNFLSSDYGADVQNWCAAQDDQGIVYIANNAGLLRYDGYHWDLYRIPGHPVVRSVMVEGDRIYVGAFEEFGYFKHNPYGELEYRSLSDALKGKYKFDNEEIWSIRRHGSEIVFQAFSAIFEFDGKRIRSMRDCSHEPLYLFTHGDDMYVQFIGRGLEKREGDRWHEVLSRERLGSNAVSMIPASCLHPEKANLSTTHFEPSEYLIFTETSGLKIFNKASDMLTPYPTDVDAELCASRINRVCMLDDGTMVIGTIRDGIFAMNPSGHLLWHYNTDNGLNNNCVLALMPDADGNIWAMLDDGISLIHTSLPFDVMIPDVHSPYMGMVYAIGHSGPDNLLLATNQGLYSWPTTGGAINALPEYGGQNWDIAHIDGHTILSNNESTGIRYPDGSSSTLPFTSTTVSRGTVQGQDVLLQGSYYDLRVYRKDDAGHWKFSNVVNGFGAPVRQIVIDADGSVWCSHLAKGIYRLKLDKSLRNVAQKTYYPQLDDNKDNSLCFAMKIHGRPAFANAEHLYEFSSREGAFVPFENFEACLPNIKGICSATQIDDSHFWISTMLAYHLVELTADGYRNVLTIPTSLFPRKNNGMNNKVYVSNSGYSYFNINDGVGRVSHSRTDLGHEANHIPAINISSAETMTRDKGHVRLPVRPDADGHQHAPKVVGGYLRATFSVPNYNHVPCRFRYVLSEAGKRTEKTSSTPEVEYADLRFGDYELTAEVLDENGEARSHVDYAFVVPRPAYLSWWAIILYVALIGGSIYLTSRWSARREVKRRQQQFEATQAEQEHKLHEQERIIAEQQRSLLESELSTKSKELATMAMSAASKQQVIESLKETISDQRRRGGSGSEVASKLMKKIESADTGNQEFWRVFEINFDLIHEHFFRDLQAQYPKLSATDMKFCALLRMNLTTKDIAKFTNLTIRGVETARYRLRKKLGLKEDENLVQFLIGFKRSQPE